MATNELTVETLAEAARVKMELVKSGKRTGLGYDALRRLGEEYVKANVAWQVAKYGRVRTRLRVESVIR